MKCEQICGIVNNFEQSNVFSGGSAIIWQKNET
jgi:hypothetical protein